MRHLIDPLDFSRQETDRLLSLAEDILARNTRYEDPNIDASARKILNISRQMEKE